jgi:predicted O-methyltransferase YrrM
MVDAVAPLSARPAESRGFLATLKERLAYRFRSVLLLIQSRAPVGVLVRYVVSMVEKLVHLAAYKSKSAEIASELAKNGRFSTDWFSNRAPHWQRIFASERFQERSIKALEIGSWEGMSACFLLGTLHDASLIAVDTWQGSEEHAEMERVKSIEEVFDFNLARFGGRVRKFKGTSSAFFLTQVDVGPFDFIYVDGSHRADDVICDAIQSWRLLAKGGVIVFDDYLWRFYPSVRDNPAAAINAFLRMKKGEYKILDVYEQLCLKKLV